MRRSVMLLAGGRRDAPRTSFSFNRMWHRFVRWIGRRSLRWVFRDVVIADAARIPSAGPVIIIANHPNDVPDVLIGYLSTPRAVHFIATISAATNPLSRATYRGLGVIPVTRVRDARKLLEKGASISNVNRVAYQRVVQALLDDQLIGVFPEGGVTTDWALRPFKPGVAQMILQCFDNANCKPVTIVPLGIQYEGPHVPGSDCVVRVGDPLEVSASDVTDGIWKVQTLTAELFRRLAAVTRHGDNAAARAMVDQVAATLAAADAASPADGLLRAGEIAPTLCSPGGAEHAILHDASVREDVIALGDAVERAGGHRQSAADHTLLYQLATARTRNVAPPLPTPTPAPRSIPGGSFDALRSGNGFLLLLTAPIAAIGWLIHAPLFAIVWRIALHFAESRAHRVGRAHLPGLYIVFGWYVLVAVVAALVLSKSGVSPLFSLLLFMPLFRLGDVAVKWRHGFVTWRFRRRVSRSGERVLCEFRDRYQRVRRTWDAMCHAPDEVQHASATVIS
jgi:1-acyl-sn-glycerol-3-phosphate acyltransferase